MGVTAEFQLVPVMVFLPAGVCSCSHTAFLGHVYEAVKKHKDIVDYSEHTTDSETAHKFGIKYRDVVVGTQPLGGNPSSADIENAILNEVKRQ